MLRSLPLTEGIDRAFTDAWAQAGRVAERPRDVVVWQRTLAQAVAAAAAPDVAGVFLCTLGTRTGLSAAIAPPEQSAGAQRLIASLLPPMGAARQETTWAVPLPSASGDGRIASPEESFTGLIGAFLRSQEGIVAGWIVLLSRAPLHQRMREIAAPFADVSRAAEVALCGSLAIAAAMGARFPRVSPAGLTAREREVATLAAGGLSDLNIGAHLGISEGTVGRHLHSIYRKLQIGSRMQLSDLVCGAAADPSSRLEGGLTGITRA